MIAPAEHFHIRTAGKCSPDTHQHVSPPDIGNVDRFDAQLLFAVEHGGGHLIGQLRFTSEVVSLSSMIFHRDATPAVSLDEFHLMDTGGTLTPPPAKLWKKQDRPIPFANRRTRCRNRTISVLPYRWRRPRLQSVPDERFAQKAGCE